MCNIRYPASPRGVRRRADVCRRSVINWVDALREAAAWSRERERRKQLGLRIAREFSWTKTAEKTLAILNSYREGFKERYRRHRDALHPVFGRTYLSGRRLNIPAVAFLVLRDVALAPFFGRGAVLSQKERRSMKSAYANWTTSVICLCSHHSWRLSVETFQM